MTNKATKDIVISTAKADFEGYANLVFEEEDTKIVKRVEGIDVWQEFGDLNASLNPDEMSGIPFMLAVRRYVMVKHGVQISPFAAQEYYNTLHTLVKDAETSFIRVLDLSGSTESSRSDIPPVKSTSTTDVQNESEPVNA